MSRADLAAEDRDEDFRFVLGSPRGRAFCYMLLDRCNVMGASFTGDAATTAFNEGRRHVGIALLRDIQAMNPSAFATMLAENDARHSGYHTMTDTQQEEFDE